MTDSQAVDLILLLQKIPGAIDYSGECSIQVVIPLKNGEWLRIGITDDDVADTKGLWFDQYEGLNKELKHYFGTKT